MLSERRSLVYSAIDIERRIQERLREEGRFAFTCAGSGMTPAEKLTVLGEELGEVGHEINEGIGTGRAVDLLKLRKELVQVAAVAVAWVESLDPKNYGREIIFYAADHEIFAMPISTNTGRYAYLCRIFGNIAETMVPGGVPLEERFVRFISLCVQWLEALDAELEHATA